MKETNKNLIQYISMTRWSNKTSNVEVQPGPSKVLDLNLNI